LNLDKDLTIDHRLFLTADMDVLHTRVGTEIIYNPEQTSKIENQEYATEEWCGLLHILLVERYCEIYRICFLGLCNAPSNSLS